MKLTTARLCLDCDEVHDEQRCPSCGSESFAFLARWVDPGDQRPAARLARAPAATDPERLEAVRALTAPGPSSRGAMRRMLGALAGLATVGVVGWVWTSSREAARRDHAPKAPEPRPPGAGTDGSDLL